MRTVAQLLEPDFTRSWYEAVALVQEVAALWKPGLSIPSPEDLIFDEDGALTLGFVDESGGNPVAGLAALLLSFLEGVEAPAALRDLARESAGKAPAHATVESFARALSFYERPGRGNDIQAMLSRLETRGARVNPDDEMKRLRERIVAKDAAKEDKEEESQPQAGRPRVTRAHILIATGTAALVVVVALVSSGQTPVFGAASGLFGRLDKTVTDGVASGLGHVGIRFLADEQKPSVMSSVVGPNGKPGQLAEAPLPNGVRTTGERGGPRDVSLPRPRRKPAASRLPANELVTTKVVELPPATASEPVEAEAPPTLIPELPLPPIDRVYSSADTRVDPPVFLRPQLAKEPEPSADTGYFDIVVNELGMVEEVKLLSPTRRFHDRILVAAAKAWKFRPATVDGRPVKYRTRVPIILSGLP